MLDCFGVRDGYVGTIKGLEVPMVVEEDCCGDTTRLDDIRTFQQTLQRKGCVERVDVGWCCARVGILGLSGLKWG